jgi:molybdate transport system ATP-binding protein
LLEFDCTARLGEFTLEAAFTVPGAGVTALFGPSGCGKTTTLRLIAGDIAPTRGRIALDGRVLVDTAARVALAMESRGIGWVFQEGRLFPHLSVQRNLDFASALATSPRARERLGAPRDRVIDVLGLARLLERWPRELSGGERQRVALGRALLSRPSVLLCDEPLAALDVARKVEILALLEQVRDEFRIPIVYVTHALGELLYLADDAVVLERGRIVAQGALGEIAGRLAVPALSSRPDAGTLIEGVVAEQGRGSVELDWGGTRLHVHAFDCVRGERVRVYVRAQDVILAAERPRAISVRNVLETRVAAIAPREHETRLVELELGAQRLLAEVTDSAAAELDLEPGHVVYALIKSVAIEAPAGLARLRGV